VTAKFLQDQLQSVIRQKEIHKTARRVKSAGGNPTMQLPMKFLMPLPSSGTNRSLIRLKRFFGLSGKIPAWHQKIKY